jgi:hypothetical protein
MRGFNQDRRAGCAIAGYAFVQKARRAATGWRSRSSGADGWQLRWRAGRSDLVADGGGAAARLSAGCNTSQPPGAPFHAWYLVPLEREQVFYPDSQSHPEG